MQHSLEIKERLKYQRVSWIVQRGGWMAMGVISFLALLGLLGGGGIFSDKIQINEAGSWVIHYQAFARYGRPMELRIERSKVNPQRLDLKWNEEFILRNSTDPVETVTVIPSTLGRATLHVSTPEVLDVPLKIFIYP